MKQADADSPWIFVSYCRGNGSGWAARQIASALEKYCGEGSVFCDTRSIQPGTHWDQSIEHGLESCQAFVVVVDSLFDSRKLADPADWVRREIQFALDRKLPIFPIVLDGAAAPASEALPSEISELSRIQATFMEGRSENVFQASMKVFAEQILETVPCEVEVIRKPAGWWNDIDRNDWHISIDGLPFIWMFDRMTSAQELVHAGPHAIQISWSEKERDRYYGHAWGPGLSWKGITEELRVVFRPGKYLITLTAALDTRGLFRWLMDFASMTNKAPRQIQMEYIPSKTRQPRSTES